MGESEEWRQRRPIVAQRTVKEDVMTMIVSILIVPIMVKYFSDVLLDILICD